MVSSFQMLCCHLYLTVANVLLYRMKCERMLYGHFCHANKANVAERGGSLRSGSGRPDCSASPEQTPGCESAPGTAPLHPERRGTAR